MMVVMLLLSVTLGGAAQAAENCAIALGTSNISAGNEIYSGLFTDYQYYCNVGSTQGDFASEIYTRSVFEPPSTGDSSAPHLWVGMCVLVGAGFYYCF